MAKDKLGKRIRFKVVTKHRSSCHAAWTMGGSIIIHYPKNEILRQQPEGFFVFKTRKDAEDFVRRQKLIGENIHTYPRNFQILRCLTGRCKSVTKVPERSIHYIFTAWFKGVDTMVQTSAPKGTLITHTIKCLE